MRLADSLKELDEKIADSNSSVSGKRGALQKKQEEQNKYQAQFERLTLSLNSSDTEIRNLKQNFQEQHSRDLMEFEEQMYKITVPASELREKLSAAKEELRLLGQVNLMAVEEFAEVKDRYERQKANYEDTQKSLDNLIRVSEEIKSKSSEMFLETYNKIKKNFHNMFRRLFNGGRAELRLADPQNVLTSGIDIFAQPPGKKLENISLLSGGEKTMTAVALLPSRRNRCRARRQKRFQFCNDARSVRKRKPVHSHHAQQKNRHGRKYDARNHYGRIRCK